MNCNYKVNIKDIQNKYKFNIFAMGGYNDSDLRKMIESVFYALPRVNGSGTSVTLNDTAFSYMKNKLYATDTSQYSTIGKNLLSCGNQTFTQATDYISIQPIQAGTYNLICDATSNDTDSTKCVFLLYNSNKEVVLSTQLERTHNDKSITISAEVSYARFYASDTFSHGAGDTATVSNVMVSVNGGDYEPYTNGASPNPDYPQVIHTITGDNKLVSYNRNLWDEQYRNGIYDYASGNFVPNNTHAASLNPIRVKPNTTYYAYTNNYPIYISEYREDMSYIKQNYSFKDNTFTTSNECYYLQFRMDGSYGTTYNNDICINISDSDNGTYTKHQENSVILTLGDKEICKIGDYEDKIFKAIKGNEIYDSLTTEEKATLDYGKWYLRKAIGKVVLDGSENWTLNQTKTYVNQYLSISSLSDNIATGTSYIMSDYFKYKQADPTDTTNEDYMWVFQNRLVLDIRKTIVVDNNALKTWVGTNRPTFYYQLATPTNELFNDTIQEQLEDIYNNMLSYEGQTNVSQVNDDLPFNINSTAIKDLNDL